MALSWTAPASDGGSSITGYEIWRGTTSGAASLLTTVGLVTSYTDASVSNGTTYYYQVAAVNAVDTGPGSNERSATPTGAGAGHSARRRRQHLQPRATPAR